MGIVCLCDDNISWAIMDGRPCVAYVARQAEKTSEFRFGGERWRWIVTSGEYSLVCMYVLAAGVVRRYEGCCVDPHDLGSREPGSRDNTGLERIALSVIGSLDARYV